MSHNSTDQNISSTRYAKRCRAIMDLDRELKALGGDNILGLPKIAVIGSQSAGKSSLVEGVSELTVPRDSGTCTRCPMECSMSSSATSWSCSISLRLRYDEDGKALASPTDVPFAVITNRSDVELAIRRSQAAILCPHRAPSEFSNMSASQLKEALNPTNDSRVLSFSKNSVHIDVKDPQLTDLSFIDLPGLIQNADMDEIELVKDLVVHNIEGQNTLILVTIPASDDIDNQQAMRLAKEADPNGDRTIAVITKPDTVGEGSTGLAKMWTDALKGELEKHNLRHGYYCVRLPNDAERKQGISRLDFQKKTSVFFDSTSPWKDIPNRGRFGVPNLVRDISSLLVNLIEQNLPSLKEKVEELIAECINNLKKLPPRPPNEPSMEILGRITKFCDALNNTVSADINKRVTQEHRSRYAEFQEAIRSTTPDFRPFEGSTSSYSMPQEKGISFITGPRDLMYVRDVIKKSIGWELPGHVPFEATKSLVLEYTHLWKRPALSCHEDIFRSLDGFIEQQLKLRQHFGDFKKLEDYVRDLIKPTLHDLKAKSLQQLEGVLELETVPLFTLNTHYLNSAETKWIARYASTRENPSLGYNAEGYSYDTPEASEASEGPYAEMSRPGTPAGTSVSEVYSLSNDEFREEIRVMAKVRAYFQVAYKRFIDYVPLTIEHGLKQPLASVIQQTLFTAILHNGSGSEKLAVLLEEDPAVVKQRKNLEERKVTLLKIKKKLDDFKESEEVSAIDESNSESESSKEQFSVYNSDSVISLSPSPVDLEPPPSDSASQQNSVAPSTNEQDMESKKKGKRNWKRFFGTA